MMNRKWIQKPNQSSQNNNDFLNISTENDIGDVPIFWYGSSCRKYDSGKLSKSAMLVFA
jgi:hypothetical protein